MEFSKHEHWSGLPFPSPGDLPDSGTEPRSLALQADSLPSEPPGKLTLGCCSSNAIWYLAQESFLSLTWKKSMNLTCKLPGPDLADLCGRNLLSEGLGACLYMCGCMLLSVVLNIIIQFSSVAQSCPTLCDPTHCSMPGFPVHHQLPELAQTHVRQVGDEIQPSHPLSSPSPPAFNLSQHQGLFKWVSLSWSTGVSASASVPFNEYLGLIPSRMNWLDLLAVQGTLKNLLQPHHSKASILWRSASFIVQLSHPHMTTGKTIALTGWTFDGKVMSLLFNMLSRLVIAFLPRSKCLLISWL